MCSCFAGPVYGQEGRQRESAEINGPHAMMSRLQGSSSPEKITPKYYHDLNMKSTYALSCYRHVIHAFLGKHRLSLNNHNITQSLIN